MMPAGCGPSARETESERPQRDIAMAPPCADPRTRNPAAGHDRGMDEETTAPDQSPSRAPSRASAALRLAGHREISADDTTFRPGPDLGSRSASLRLQLFTTPPDRAGSTPAEATRTCHGFPSRNPNRTRRDTHHATTVLEQARRENVPIEELVSYVERHALAADASEWQRQLLKKPVQSRQRHSARRRRPLHQQAAPFPGAHGRRGRPGTPWFWSTAGRTRPTGKPRPLFRTTDPWPVHAVPLVAAL